MEKYRLNKEDVCLLVIDVQEKLVPIMKHGKAIIKNTQILLQGAKEMGIPVIATEQYPKGLGSTVADLRAFFEDEDVFAKNSFTAYTEDVQNKIETLGPKKIIVTGMETHVCVYQTVRDLLDAGYEVHIAKDCVGSRTKENYQNGLDLMENMGAIINNTETIVFDLLKVSGTKEFKIMSALIK